MNIADLILDLFKVFLSKLTYSVALDISRM